MAAELVGADNPSISSVGEFSSDQDDLRFVVVGKSLFQYVPLQNALRHFAVPISYSETGLEHLDDADSDTVFIVEDFEGTVFENLNSEECRIVAPPVIIRAAISCGGIVPYSRRPVYCTVMEGLVICFSGIRKKEELVCLASLVHRMGGSIRKEFSASVTHLVSARSGGDKYKTAVGMGVQIMSVDWVHKCWGCRDNTSISAIDQCLMKYKLKPFSFCVLSFFGFSSEDLAHMTEVTKTNDGTCVDAGSIKCTHLVVNELVVKTISVDVHDCVYIVKSEWFWASIQMEACADESIYLYEAPDENLHFGSGFRKTSSSVSLAGSRSHKRKRIRETLAQMAQEGETPAIKSRRSINTDPARRSLNMDNATLNLSTTITSDNTCENLNDQSVVAAAVKDTSKLTPRQQTIMELLHTETNYVCILNTILKVFKEEIEKTDQPGGPILDPQESKAVFGGIPPIFDVHSKIRDELNETVTSSTWLVGRIFMKHAEALSKSYPSFVNYFEKTKESIQQCDRLKPRFHAFLRLCQSKTECGRQSLTELFIRPVQRLPSVLLLLRDILKRTEKNQPDYEDLNTALKAIDEVMTHINEDKRRAEGHQTLFGIVNDIENCPPNLLSAHRVFIQKINSVEVSDELSGKGTSLTLFIFSDSLEVAKNRAKAQGGKSPGVNVVKSVQRKPYKHFSLIPFSSVKRIVDIVDRPECRDVFSLIIKKLGDSEEKLYSFLITDDSVQKSDFLTSLSKTVCASQCRTDYETLLAVVEARVLNIDGTDLHSGKTFARVASKFGKRVSRVLSSNKTPQNSMKRAISSTSQIFTPSLSRDSSTMSTSSMSSWSRSSASYSRSTMDIMESGDEVLDADSYSGIVDLMSLNGATPLAQNSRETPIRGSDTMSLGRFADSTAPRMRPLSIRQAISTAASTTAIAPTPGETRTSTLRQDAIGSRQSLASANEAKRLDARAPIIRRPPPSSMKSRPGETCI